MARGKHDQQTDDLCFHACWYCGRPATVTVGGFLSRCDAHAPVETRRTWDWPMPDTGRNP